MEYHCTKCKRDIAGSKPRKSRDLCSGCQQDWYNYNRAGRAATKDEKCWSYGSSKVIIKDVYYSSSQIVPNVAWKLSCFNYKRN